MKAQVKQTKRNTYIKINGEVFQKNNDWSTRDFKKIDDLETIDFKSFIEVDGIDTDTVYQNYIDFLKGNKEERQAERKQFEENLSDFWKDVSSRNGMDVCTPFIERFAGHSFVAYDKGFIWSKTLKSVFKLRDFSGSKAYYPKSFEKVFSFGSDLSELDKK